MSLYSETIGSFIRTDNYPLEANYIFNTAEALNSFYAEPLNRTTLHIGLIRVVEDEKALYWAVPDEDNYLHFEKLLDYNTLDSTNELKESLEQEILNRTKADLEIYGTSDIEDINNELNNIIKLSTAILELQKEDKTLKSILLFIAGTTEDDIVKYLLTLDYKNLTEISEAIKEVLETTDIESYIKELREELLGDPEPTSLFRTLRGILDFVLQLASLSKNRADNLLTELDQTLVGVGLSSDGSYSPDLETKYLKNATSVMNALKTLDALIDEAINNCNLDKADSETVELNICKGVDKTVISAKVKLSADPTNDILAKTDGLYANIDSEYEKGILTIRVNGNVRLLHVLGLSSVVDTAYYDTDLESIIIIFKLLNGDTLTVTIPAASLISEWEVDNSFAYKAVELTKERVVAGGADKLSADVRLSTNKLNILERDGNTLIVRGISENITHNGSSLDTIIDNITDDIEEILEKFSLENAPIFKDFLDSIADLPEDAKKGDKYIVKVISSSGKYSYILAEYDGSTWNLKFLTTGNVGLQEDGPVWKLNSTGVDCLVSESDINSLKDLEESNVVLEYSLERGLTAKLIWADYD